MSSEARRWVLASGNPGKLREIRALLASPGFSVEPQSKFGLASPEETGATFIENALLKARHAALATGLPAIADDSGLVVDALGGAPGIRSARFAGPEADDGANVAKLLQMLDGVADERRGASFCCVLLLLRDAEDPMPLIGLGEWRGSIAREPRGDSGFGYDPVFFDPELGATAAELSSELKNRVSHRGQALAGIQRALRPEA